MHLTEVHLRNWRSYRNAMFRFPTPTAGKNVILVGAQNGFGKTSLLIALYLGLFGREALRFIEGIRVSGLDDERGLIYKTLVERILHRPAIGSDEPRAAVKLKFATKDGDVAITRTWHFSRGGRAKDLATRDGEEVLIETNGTPKIFPTWQDANAQIDELLFPNNVMPCFFFDGEQAQERVEEAGGRALLEAVNTLYGTGILDDLSESLRTYIANEKSTLKRDIGDVRPDELDEKRELLEKLKDDYSKIQTVLTEKRKERDIAEQERQRVTNELHQLVGDSTADIEEYAANIRALESDQLTVRQELTRGLSSLSIPLSLMRNGPRVLEILQAEQIRDRWLLLKDEATGKASKIINDVLPESPPPRIDPPLSTHQVVQLRAKLEKALETLWSPPPEGCADNYFFHFLREADRAAIRSKIERHRAGNVPDVADAVMRWDNIGTRLRETQRRFDSVRDIQPRLTDLKNSISEITERIKHLNAEYAGLETKELGMQAEIRDLKGAIGQMEKKRSLANPVQEKLEVAHRVRTIVDEAKDRLIPLCKAALEERCTHHFRNMISDEYRNFHVKFHTETEPCLESDDEQLVYVTSLSGAQKRAFGLAFTLAVADVSGQAAPIVIDTPVGNMDSHYRDRVLQYVATSAPGQVIFLSHDEEISDEYRKKLRPRTVGTFLVQFSKIADGSGESTVVEGKYFGD